jgi:GTP-binding protein HflX
MKNFQYENINSKENAILVALKLPGHEPEEINDHLSELEQLARTAGLNVTDRLVQERSRIHITFFIGPGKVDELKDRLEETESRIVIFDDDLGPAQIRNLENSLDAKVIDRSTLILDIFARHARTREAKTQVELAQLEYFLPRLTRQWTHLSRQVGGIGTRGPGETQLETDRRLIRKRIEKLRSDLKKIDQQQTIRRQNRHNIFRASLIGYTNAGKSTLMNLLSGANVLVEDQLFATLDSVVRRLKLDEIHEMLLTDTVGFIRKLPAHLVASFKSTLDEVREADLLIHIVDINHPHFREHMRVVKNVLEELDAHLKPVLIVFNKIDQLDDLSLIQSLKLEFPESVFISAFRQIGLESLKSNLRDFIERYFVDMELSVPVKFQKFIYFLHTNCLVQSMTYEDSTAMIKLKCDRQLYDKIKHLYEDLNNDVNIDKDHEEILR